MRTRRGITAALVVAVPLAALLDAWGPPLPGIVPALMWLDVAAAACLAWAALQPGAWKDREGWATPFDGLVLALLALATVGTVGQGAGGSQTHLLRQSIGCGGAFFGLAFVLRRTPGASEFAWRSLAVFAAVLGAHALWAATGGLGTLERQAREVDAVWTGSHGLARMLAFATVATAGRAAERNAAAGWRLAFLVGTAGLAVHAAAGGFAVNAMSLGRLDDPMDFSVACIVWMLASALARGAWKLRKERRDEAWRWRALAGAAAGLGVASVFGDGGSGEGVRTLAVLAAVAVLGSPAEAEVAATADVENDPPLARAA